MPGLMMQLCVGLCMLAPAMAQSRLLVTAVDARTGRLIKDLRASDVVITDDKAHLTVVDLKPCGGPADVMLLLDTGHDGSLVQPLAYELIDEMRDPEQMALVGYADSAELIVDFSASQERLKRALAKVRYANEPKVLDALIAAISEGIDHATYRRAILVLTAGYDSGRPTELPAVVKLAREHRVSLFPIFVAATRRGLWEDLARQTGGAAFNLKDMARDASQTPAARIFEVARSPYLVTIGGKASPSGKMKLEAKRSGKTFLSALPVE